MDLILNKNKNVDSQRELIKFFKDVNLLSFTRLKELLEENYRKIYHKIQLDDINLILFKYNKEFISMIKNDMEDLNKNHNIQ